MIRICACVLFCVAVFAEAATVEPYDLTVEYMTAPVGIDTPEPRISWKSQTSDKSLKNVVQTAYQVMVASSLENLDKNVGDLWDSGKVESNQSLNIEYAGKPLETSQRCYFKVRVWYAADGKPLADAVSEPSRWVMGVMQPSDWHAKWIASGERFRPDFDMKDAQWICAGDATDLFGMPQGTTYFRKVFDWKESDDQVILATAILAITADDEYKVYINGQPATQTWGGNLNDWRWMRFIDVRRYLKPGKNLIAVEVNNKERGPTALLATLESKYIAPSTFSMAEVADKLQKNEATNSSWLSSSEPTEGWNTQIDFESDKWKPATEVGPVDCEPWRKINRRFDVLSPAFGKTFDVAKTKKVKTATLHITGVGFYEASLNGTKIGNKVLDPAQTRYDKRVLYSTYDLTDSLKSGANRLNVLVGHGWYDVRSVAVWNFDNAPWRDFPRMIAQLEIVYDDGTKQLVVSDYSWDQIASPIIFDCIRQGEASKSFTGSNGVPNAETNKKIWTPSVVDGPKGKLVAEAIPPSVITEEWKPVSITEPSPGVYVVDTGQNMAGWIRLKIDDQEPHSIVRIKYAERLAADGNIDMRPINEHFRYHVPFLPKLYEKFQELFQVDLFFLTGDTTSGVYEPRFMYHGFQYVEITGLSKKPTADDITVCAVNSDFKSAGKFECSNELFNKIQQATLWAYRSNFVNGVPTDCPHREKNGWTGDAQLACEQAQYNWENTACYEKWVRDLLDEQQPDGNLPGIVPTSGWGYAWGNGPAWDSAICVVPWTLYQYKGDKRILEEAYDGMKRYVDYVTSRAHKDGAMRGLVDHGLGDWVFAKTETPTVVTSSVYYFVDATIVSETAKLLGKDDDSTKYADLATKIRADYIAALVKEDGTIANGSQTAQSFPLYYDVIFDNDQRKAVAQKLFAAVEKADNHLDVGILGAKSLFHTLSKFGRTDLVMQILNQKTPPSYGAWFQRGATTLWEDWGDGSSRNHIMFGDISTWFYRTLGGIRFPSRFQVDSTADSTAAANLFVIAPKYPEGIDWVKAEHDSPFGVVGVSWKRDGAKIKLEVSVPVNENVRIFTPSQYADFGSGEYSFEFDSP
ncbi:MAG: family 78 glycoside hydrolase catalytic domain [Thermoguttaceae bacterium]